MSIGDKDRVPILLAALSERYNSLHIIRARVETTGVWVIGLALAAGGWLLQASAVLSDLRRGVLITGVIAALGIIRFVYLADLQSGFRTQQRAAVRIEEALKLYDTGVFDSTDSPIYPTAWKHAGTRKSSGRFFQTTYLLLYVAAIFLVVCIIASGSISTAAGQ